MSEDDGLKAMGQIIQMMKPELARWFAGRSRTLNRCWTRKRIGFAVQDVLKAGRTPGSGRSVVPQPGGRRNCDTSLEQPGLPNAA
jgi:hypothetical protein